MNPQLPRRHAIGLVAAALGTPRLFADARGASSNTAPPMFQFCLNTSTIRGQKLTLAEEVEVAAAAGYDGIEPWIGEIQEHQQSGGSLEDLAKQLADHGLTVFSAIGFANWIVDDPAERRKGLETARHDMDLVRRIGGTHIAAPPAGATSGPDKLDLFAVAERYAKLVEVGRNAGVIPQVEVWGFSHNLARLGEAVLVAIESGCPEACVLPDVYHIYKGGSEYAGLQLLAPGAVHCFHLNDYPADPPRETIADEHRVYPGDGAAPLDSILAGLSASGAACALSLELFNRELWQQPALEVARTGLHKMKAACGLTD